MKIIVLNTTVYKEKDLIVNAITENGELNSFKARGALNNTSSYSFLNTPLVEAEVEYVENSRYIHQILKEATLINTPLTNDMDLNKMTAYSLLLQVLNSMIQDEDKGRLYLDVKNYIKMVKEKDDLNYTELIFLAKAIKISGNAPEVGRCVLCGSRSHIVAFNFVEGGFLCRNCLTPDVNPDLTPEQMLLIRYLFLANNYDDLEKVDNLKVTKEDIKAMFVKFKEYIDDGVGVRLDAIDNIIKTF